MILFVCSQSFLRSRTAELLCCMGGLEARCAGTDRNALYTVNDELLSSAQYIFCMEKRHLKEISRMAGFDRRRAVVLNIPDDYPRFDPALVDLLIKRTAPFDEKIAAALERGWALHQYATKERAARAQRECDGEETEDRATKSAAAGLRTFG